MSILGAHNIKLKVMLYESATRLLKQAICDLEAGDFASHAQNIEKTKDIIAELKSALDTDPGGQTTQNMRQFYIFMSQSLSEAAHKHDPKILYEMVDILEELNKTWRQATY